MYDDPLFWLYHAKVKGNHAGFFPHFYRLFGTYARGYAEDRERRARRA